VLTARGSRCASGKVAALTAVVAVGLLRQQTGQIVPETKLDLVVAPWRFLVRATSLWDDLGGFGHVQNQAVGYLFPMGPTFALGDAAAIPPWVVQRLWAAALVVAAAAGCVRLASALGVGTPTTRWIGGFAYAFSPALTGLVLFQSGGQLPYAVAPWVLSPLVTGWTTGDVRRAAARSALALALCGGVNAAATAAAALLPAMWLVTRPPSARHRALTAWWLTFSVAATAWWTVPLALQGRFGLDFTRYTEQAATTTSAASLTHVLRGTGNWLYSLVTPAGVWLPGSRWMVVAVPAAVAGAVVIAVGVGGLARQDLAHRRFLILAFAIGVTTIAAGYGGSFGGPFAGTWRELLDGALSPFRNVAKLQPALRLPMALGTAHLLACLPPPPRVAGRLVALSVVAAVAVATLPLWRGDLAAPGSFERLPPHWHQLASWLEARRSDGRALLLPGSAFAEYRWGRPLDEPLQPLAEAPWAVRNLIPLGGTGSTRILDAVEDIVDGGRPAPELVAVLQRAGVGFLVVRHELDQERSSGPSSTEVAEVLSGTPGITAAATFGPLVAVTGRPGPTAGHGRSRAPSLEVFAVGGARLAEVTPVDGGVVLHGGPEATTHLAAADLLDGRTVALAGDPEAPSLTAPVHVTTDASRRRDLDFGVVHGAGSPTVAAGVSVDQRPVLGGGRDVEATATVIGAQAVRASSTLVVPRRLPEVGPMAAIDGDASSAWVPGGAAIGEWLEISFGDAVGISTLEVVASGGAEVELDIDVDGRSVTALVTDVPTEVRLDATTHFVRLTVVAARGGGSGVHGPGIAEVTIPGRELRAALALPPVTTAAPTALVVERSVSDPFDLARADEDAVLRRTVSVAAAQDLEITGTAVPRPGEVLDAFVAGLTSGGAVDVDASSTRGDLPTFAAERAFDSDPTTAWLSSTADIQPTLTLRFPTVVTIDELVLHAASGATVAPTSVTIEAGGVRRQEDVGDGGTVHFASVTSNVFVLVFPPPVVAPDEEATAPTLGITEIVLPDLGPIDVGTLRRDADIDVPCGSGPGVRVGDQVVRTAVHGTVDDVLRLRPLLLVGCDETQVPAGTAVIEASDRGPFAVGSLSLQPLLPRPRPVDRAITRIDWGDGRRDVAITAGAAAVLSIAENFNEGWSATVDGRALAPVRTDGWRQGFVIPAGVGGTVAIRFEPDRWMRPALLTGGGLLLAVAVVALRRPRPRRTDRVPAVPEEGGNRLLLLGVSAATVAIVCPAAAIAVPVLDRLPGRYSVLAAVAAVAAAAAGMLALVDTGSGSQLLAGTALAAVFVAGVPARPQTSR
jgi:arabinofuranan 3-O-arabinosyltransferase